MSYALFAAGGPVFALSEKQWEHFLEVMQNPEPPTPAMIDAHKALDEYIKDKK